MALLDFEQYPDYAMKTNKQGERVREPWASGPSPLAMALMAGGFGMMGDSASEWVGGGGTNWDALGRGGLLGVQAFGQGHRDLQGQRKDFYTQANALEDQLIQNQKAKRDHEESVRLKRLRENRDKSFPELLKMLTDSKRPEVQMAVPQLQLLYATSPEKGVAAAMNIVSQLEKTPGEIKVHSVPGSDGQYLTQGGKFVAQFKGSGTSGSDNLTKGRLRSSLLRGNLSIPDYIATYDMLLRENARAIDEGTQGGASKKYLVSPQLGGLKSKWDYITDLGGDPEEYGITKESSSLRELIGTSQKKFGAEDKKLLLKIQTIEGEEKFIQELFKKGYDPTAQNFDAFWSYTFTGKPMPTTEAFADSRSYENMAMGGSQMFGYLVSGAAVREDEMLRMRMIFYPYAGDSKDDVIRKKSLRDSLINMSKSFSVEEIAQKFKDVDISDDVNGTGNLLNALKTPNPARIQAGDGASQILNRNGIPVTTSNIQKLRIANPKVINSNGEVVGNWQNHVLSFRGLNPVKKPVVQEVIPFEPETSILSESDLLKIAKEIILEETQ